MPSGSGIRPPDVMPAIAELQRRVYELERRRVAALPIAPGGPDDLYCAYDAGVSVPEMTTLTLVSIADVVTSIDRGRRLLVIGGFLADWHADQSVQVSISVDGVGYHPLRAMTPIMHGSTDEATLPLMVHTVVDVADGAHVVGLVVASFGIDLLCQEVELAVHVGRIAGPACGAPLYVGS